MTDKAYTQADSNSVGWYFPNLGTPPYSPDCSEAGSGITDNELRDTILGHWPIENGVAKVPYGFSILPYWVENIYPAILSLISNSLKAYSIQNESQKNYIRAALNNWEKASNGSISFYESDRQSFWGKGIYFYLTDQSALDTFSTDAGSGAGAVTYPYLDNNGELSKAFVFYPSTPSFWNATLPPPSYTDEYIVNTIEHEIGHAIGFDHLHAFPSIKYKLENTPSGLYCSVMPYPYLIATNTSECPLTSCDPFYTPYPGNLDSRLIDVGYRQSFPSCHAPAISMLPNSFQNLGAGIIVSGMYSFVDTFISNLERKPDQKLMPEKIAHLIVDSGFGGALIYMGAPALSTSMFAITAATKYMPEKFIKKMPQKLQTLFLSYYSIHAFNLVRAYLQGQCFLPAVTSIAASGVGSVLGSSIGGALGSITSGLVNLIPHAISNYQQSNNGALVVETTNTESRNEITIDISNNLEFVIGDLDAQNEAASEINSPNYKNLDIAREILDLKTESNNLSSPNVNRSINYVDYQTTSNSHASNLNGFFSYSVTSCFKNLARKFYDSQQNNSDIEANSQERESLLGEPSSTYTL